MAINKIPGGGKPQNDPFAAAKRKIFLGAIPAGILIMLAVWGIGPIQNNGAGLDNLLLPLLAFLFLVLVVLLWLHIMPLHTFEVIFYAVVWLYALCEFVSIITTIIQTGGSFNPSFLLWLPFVYILSFLVLPTRQALLLSACFYLTTLILGLVCCLYFLVHGLAFPRISLLMQMYFSTAFYIAALYLVARLKEQYVSEQGITHDLSRLATIDSLTQIYNRHKLAQYLREEVTRAERYHLPLSIILFDLDWFKGINDSFGHNAGDEVLREVAHQLRQTIRTSDPFGRWGGDEFLCLATNTDGKHAVELAERLRDILQKCHFTTVRKVTASFGVTTYQKGDYPETLIRRADMGLYKAKARGRNRVESVLAGVTLPIFEGEKPYPRHIDEKVEHEGG